MKKLYKVLLAGNFALMMLFLGACQDKDYGDSAMDNIEDAGEEIGHEADEIGDDIEDAVN